MEIHYVMEILSALRLAIRYCSIGGFCGMSNPPVTIVDPKLPDELIIVPSPSI